MSPESTLLGSGLGLQNALFYTKFEYSKFCDNDALYSNKVHLPSGARAPTDAESAICAALPKTGPVHNQHTLVLVLCWLLNWGGVNMAVVRIVGHVGWGTEGFKGPLTVEYL